MSVDKWDRIKKGGFLSGVCMHTRICSHNCTHIHLGNLKHERISLKALHSERNCSSSREHCLILLCFVLDRSYYQTKQINYVLSFHRLFLPPYSGPLWTRRGHTNSTTWLYDCQCIGRYRPQCKERNCPTNS